MEYHLVVDAEGKKHKIQVIKLKHFECNFSNLYEFLRYLCGIAERNDLHELDCFIDKDYSPYEEEFPEMYGAETLGRYVIDFIGKPPEGWFNFEKQKLIELLNRPFFDDYFLAWSRLSGFEKEQVKDFSKIRGLLPEVWITHFLNDGSAMMFKMILYTFTKVQSIAVSRLPKLRSEMVWYFLCYQDLIEDVMFSRFYESIATIYKRWGRQWFCHDNVNFDPVLYKWACYAIAACKYTNAIEKDQLKKDLSDLYSEFLILSVRSDSLEKNKQYLNYIQNEINHFDDLEIKSLKNEMKDLQHRQLELLDDKETLEKSYAMLSKEMAALQKDSTRTDDEKAKGILDRLYAAFPEKDPDLDAIKNISEIWDRLAERTRKDIKMALDIFTTFQRVDISSFLLISSIERELNRNYFVPFKESQFYREISNTTCLKEKYQKTHEALYKTKPHPSMGSIPFIGRAVSSPKAADSSMVIAKFTEFLAEEKEPFCKICSAIDKYRVGLDDKFSLIKIRNGIAHGDAEIGEQCDANCFSEIKSFICDPPLQIMMLIIVHSKRTC
mgnify:CR=1 FL=1